MSCFLTPSIPYRVLMENLNHDNDFTMKTISKKNTRMPSNMVNKTVLVNKQESVKIQIYE